jgi:hypothetical protein
VAAVQPVREYQRSHKRRQLLGLLRPQQFCRYWKMIVGSLVAKVDRGFFIYEGLTFKEKRFADFLAKRQIDWPRTDKGHLKLDKDTFKAQARLRPEFEPLRQLRDTLGGLPRLMGNLLFTSESSKGRISPSV